MLTMKTIFLAAALTMLLSPAAYCLETSAEAIIARSRTQLETETAVLFHDEVDAYIVVAARDRSLEGQIVYLKHILSGPDTRSAFLYYKPGATNAVIKNLSESASYPFSLEESIALRQHFVHKVPPKRRIAARVNLARAARRS
jgi:hypothetical protein